MRIREIIACLAAATLAVALAVLRHAAPAGAASSSVAIAPGARFETVYDWRRARCAVWDAPDAPLRALRNDRGEVMAYASSSDDRPFTGPRLDAIRHVCDRVYSSANNPDPAAFDYFSYVVATWTADGRTVEALLHEEFHAERVPGACRYQAAMPCWYNAVVAARSTDGGHHFAHTDTPPVLVAAAAFRQEAEQGRHRGFFNPSGIVGHDGWFYTLIATTGGGAQPPGVCLFRTATPTDPRSWRAFDGKDFAARAIDPYRGDVRQYRPCQPLTGLPNAPESVAWSARAGRFVAVMTVGAQPDRPDGGIMAAWSDDLIHWSDARMLLDAPSMFSTDCRDTARYAYAALLDPDSPSRNFDVLADRPYLYATRFNVTRCGGGPDRDLVRIPLMIGGR